MRNLVLLTVGVLLLCISSLGDGRDATTDRDDTITNKTLEEEKEEERHMVAVASQAVADSKGGNQFTNQHGKLFETSIVGVYKLTQIDYKGPAKKVAFQIAEAVMPMIAAGLAFIPGVGPLISGVFLGVWSVISSIFGEKKENPMEKMIKDLHKNIEDIHKKMGEMEKRITEGYIKHSHEQMKKLISTVIRSELPRNKYICDKYAVASYEAQDDLKNKRPINETTALRITSYIENCDIFLKDTSTAFVFPEYADILWVPSAITTLVRGSFLTEVINHGPLLYMSNWQLSEFWKELKSEIDRQFQYFGQGMIMRIREINGNLTSEEVQACRMQSQLLYLDREVYPFGVPQQVVIHDDKHELKVEQFKATGNDEFRHIQVFYNELGRRLTSDNDDYPENLVNCFIGPISFARVPRQYLTLGVLYLTGKSYEVRVLYFQRHTVYHVEGGNYKTGRQTAGERHMVVTANDENSLQITFAWGKRNESYGPRFSYFSAYIVTSCDSGSTEHFNTKERCKPTAQADEGLFTIDTAGVFDVFPDKSDADAKTVRGEIAVENDGDMAELTLFGLELIVSNSIKVP